MKQAKSLGMDHIVTDGFPIEESRKIGPSVEDAPSKNTKQQAMALYAVRNPHNPSPSFSINNEGGGSAFLDGSVGDSYIRGIHILGLAIREYRLNMRYF